MAMGAEEQWQGMRSGVQGGGDGSLWFWALLVLGAIAIAGFIIYFRRKNQQEKGLRGGMLPEDDDINLTDEQWELLHKLSDEIDTSVEKLTKDKKTFEEAVEAYLSHVSDFFPRPCSECTEVAELRKALGFVYNHSSILYSTRGLQTGDTLRLSVACQHEDGPIEARVNCVAEDFLEVELSETVQTGDEVTCICFGRVGRYSFPSRVARTSSGGKKCLLEHKMDPERRERRSSRRVKAEGTVYCRPVQGDSTEWQKMEVVDLSEGGIRLHGSRLMIVGTDDKAKEQVVQKVKVRLFPEEIINAEVGDEIVSRWILTSARILEVRHLGVDDYEYRESFVETDPELQRTLSRLLYLLETRNSE